MNKSVLAIAKLNFKTINAAYIATIICVGVLAGEAIIEQILMASGDMPPNVGISAGWALWLAPVLAGILIPAKNFKRIVALGGERKAFFFGAMLSYVILAGAVSLIGAVLYYAVDLQYNAYGAAYLYSVPDVFGWASQGPVVFFLRQFAFLLLSAAFAHTMTSLQGKWYGWVANAIAIAVICVFPPIAPLLAILAGYIQLILFQPNALIHIGVCIVVAALLFALSRPAITRRVI